MQAVTDYNFSQPSVQMWRDIYVPHILFQAVLDGPSLKETCVWKSIWLTVWNKFDQD